MKVLQAPCLIAGQQMQQQAAVWQLGQPLPAQPAFASLPLVPQSASRCCLAAASLQQALALRCF